MFEVIQRELAARGVKAVMIDIHRLQEVKQELERWRQSEELNRYQNHILDSMYEFSVPETGFEVRSMLLTASPVYSYVTTTFTVNGKAIPLKTTSTYRDSRNIPGGLESFLNELLSPNGYHVKTAKKPPLKRLAVSSGLAEYGRNNITYVEGLGSFYGLALFLTDLPCENDTWREVRRMERCEGCKVCSHACPTGAIREERVFIDNMKCLTYFNETAKSGEFPEWIPRDAHNAVFECLHCQLACPVNREYIGNTAPDIHFDEEETGLLLHGAEFDKLPDTLKAKVKTLHWERDLDALPRNLKVLM